MSVRLTSRKNRPTQTDLGRIEEVRGHEREGQVGLDCPRVREVSGHLKRQAFVRIGVRHNILNHLQEFVIVYVLAHVS